MPCAELPSEGCRPLKLWAIGQYDHPFCFLRVKKPLDPLVGRGWIIPLESLEKCMPNLTAHRNDSFWLPLFGAWLVALVSTLGALFIGEVMGQAPCDLCWYQRSFMFPLVVILGIAAIRADNRIWIYAAPIALVGFTIAAFHNLVFFKILPTAIKPCGKGPSCSGDAMTLFGVVPLPVLALAAFATILGLLQVARYRSNK